MRGAIRPVLAAILLLVSACATEDPGAGATSTAGMVTTSSLATTTTTHASTTTRPPTTTVTSNDLVNPMAGTLAGVQVGQGPVEPVLEALTAAYGPPEEDRGWTEDACIAGITTRHVLWSGLATYLEESESGQTILGYTLDQSGVSMVAETVELPGGIELGMLYSEAAALYPEGVYHHESLELDGVMLQESPMVAVMATASPDGSAPIDQLWVGAIPTCH